MATHSQARARPQDRAQILHSLGARDPELQALLEYNEADFDLSGLQTLGSLPLPSEPHVQAWASYAIAAQAQGSLFEVLQNKLMPFRFPIQAGISQTAEYRSATLRGIPPDPSQPGLQLAQPQALQLVIHPTLAGEIPILIAAERADFESLVRALLHKNEPVVVPAAIGAYMVAGIPNWDRIAQLRQAWVGQHPGQPWGRYFREQVVPHKALYQDALMLLSDAPYSGIPAATMGLAEPDWRKLSLLIRREHESTHYLTRRILGRMRNNLMDELMADYRGIVAAVGRFRADWFLLFLGLEDFPTYRAGGRLEHYRGIPPLSDSAFQLLQQMVVQAAHHLESVDRKLTNRDPISQMALILALAGLTLEELVASEAVAHILSQYEQVRAELLNGRSDKC